MTPEQLVETWVEAGPWDYTSAELSNERLAQGIRTLIYDALHRARQAIEYNRLHAGTPCGCGECGSRSGYRHRCGATGRRNRLTRTPPLGGRTPPLLGAIVSEKRKMSCVLTFKEKFDLSNLLMNRAEELMKDRPAFTELARNLTKELGREIVPNVVKGLLRSFNIVWEPRRSATPPMFGKTRQDLMNEIEKMNRRSTELEATVTTLLGLVHHLYRELNAKPPAGYTLPQGIDTKQIELARVAAHPNTR